MSVETKFNDENIAVAREMRRLSQPWSVIASRLGVDRTTVRRILDPEWRKMRNAQIAAGKARADGTLSPKMALGSVLTAGPDRTRALYDPLRDGDLYPRDLTGALCGDPPAGRSALDRRNGQHVGG